MNDQPRHEPEPAQPDPAEPAPAQPETAQPEAELGAEALTAGAAEPGAEAAAAEPGAEAAAAEPARKRLGRAFGRAVERSAERSPRMGALAQQAQRAQQNAREGLAAARKAPAVERAFEAGRVAREAAKPRLSKAREGVQQRVVDHPDATAKVARALTIAVLHAAAATNPENASLKESAPAMGDKVGKAVSKLIARTQRHAAAGAQDEAAAIGAGTASGTTAPSGMAPGGTAPGGTAPSTTAPSTTAPGLTAPGGTASGLTAPGTTAPGTTVPSGTAPGTTVPSGTAPGGTAPGGTAGNAGSGARADEPAEVEPDLTPAELAASLGVRPPPDPTALYREGPGTFELVLPLPAELAALPWDSLSRRNRFGLLVAAWALRESDGITLLKGGDLDRADDVFQECLIRAQYVQTPELVARSYEDLAELATVSGDENAARAWRAAAAQTGDG